MTSLSELVCALEKDGPHGPCARRASVALSNEAHALGRRCLKGYGFARDVIEDLVQAVLVQILVRTGHYRDKEWGYVVRSLQNLARTRLRGAARAAHLSMDAPEARALAAATHADPVDFEERWTLLDRAAEHAVLQRKREIDRGPFRESYAQIKALREGRVSMRELLAQHREADDAAGARREQNRLHKAHERCRDDVHKAIHLLYELGRFSEDDRDLALKQHGGLFRMNLASRKESTG